MSRKLKNKSKKVLPKAQTGRFLIGSNSPRFVPPKIRHNFINSIRNYYPNLDIRGTGTNPNLFSGINELGMPTSNFANLTDYEKTALGRFNIGEYQPIDPRFNNLVQNYQHLNTDKNLAIDMANMAVDFSQISPGSYFEVLTKGKPSPFMSEIFRDPNINVFNARNPAINDAKIDYGSYSFGNQLRDNFSGEFEKNLRSYGNHGFYANQVPLSGATEIANRFMPANMQFRPYTNYGKGDMNFANQMSLAPEGTYPYNIKTTPGYNYLQVGNPVADYMVTGSTMGSRVDPITNLGKYRGRGEMDNQHNFLLGRTNSPSIIISGDQGFAGMRGGNDKRRLWSGIDTPGRGKNVLDINTKVAPLLSETFNLNTPLQGTFMKFPYMNTYERTIDGNIPRTERINPVTGEVESISSWQIDDHYKAFNDLTTDNRIAYKKNFDWLRPMSKENHFYPGTFLNQDGSPFNVDFDYTRGVLANPKLGQIDQYIPRHFLGFDWGMKPNYGLPNKYDYPNDFDIRSLPNLNKKLEIGGELPKAQWGGFGSLFKKPNISRTRTITGGNKPIIGLKGGKQYDYTNKRFLQPLENTNIYRKTASNRTHPVIGDYSFSSMQGEYDWLQNAGQMSDRFVIAKNPIYNNEGQLISYDMPNLTNDGYITLNEFFDKSGDENFKSLFKTEKSIDGLLQDINKQGLFHLDMHTNNIMVKPGFGGTILDYKIIDPVGLPQITPDTDFSTFAPLEFNQLKLNLHPTFYPETTQSTRFNNVMDFYGGIEKDRYQTILLPNEAKFNSKGEWKKEGGSLPKAETGNFPWDIKGQGFSNIQVPGINWAEGVPELTGTEARQGINVSGLNLSKDFNLGKNWNLNLSNPAAIYARPTLDNMPVSKWGAFKALPFEPKVSLSYNFKEGAELPKAQFGRFKFSPKVRNKMTTDGNLLPVKKFDKLIARNFTTGEQQYLQNLLLSNPSLVQNGNINLNNLELAANRSAMSFKFQDINDFDTRMIDGVEGVRSRWTDVGSVDPTFTYLTGDTPDFGLYRYPEILPSQFGYLNQSNIRSPYMEFKGDQIIPTNFSIGMTGLNKPFLDNHHDGLHILDPGAHGWMRGFVDKRFPNRYNLKELQTDINKDPMFDLLKSKNTSQLSEQVDRSKHRIDRNEKEIARTQNELQLIQQRKNEIYGRDEYADELADLEYREQGLIQSLEYQMSNYPIAKRIMANTDGDMSNLIQLSRIGFDPYARLNNEAFSFLQNKGFDEIVIPNAKTIAQIQGWDPELPNSYKGTLNYYNTLQNNSQLINTGNTFELDNYGGNIFNLQRTQKPFELFKKYGGQTSTYSLDTKHQTYKKGAEVYKHGGQTYSMEKAQKGKETNTFDQEYAMFENWLQEQEASWDYIKNTPSSVLKPDGKTYYMMYEDNKFYPYYFKNSNGTVETEATVGFGMKGADVYETYKDGMSLEEAETGRKKDIDNALRKTKIFIDANYGDGSYDKLDNREKFMLADFTYNLGRLSKYPKFADAVMTNNFDEALAQYIRKDEEGGTELARNDAYLNTYLQPWINSEQERIAEEAANLERMNNLMQEQLVIPADNTMVGQNSFGGWKAGGETIKNKKMKAKDLAYFKNGGSLKKAQDGYGLNSATLLSNPNNQQSYLMNKMQNILHQNRIDQYYEPYGGIEEHDKMRKWAQYQDALATGNESIINAYKSLYPEFENMSYGDAFALSRQSQEFASPGAFGLEGENNPMFKMPYDDKGMPNFRWNNNVYGVEEGDDNIFDWRSGDQINTMFGDIDQQMNMDFLIANPDLANAKPEDYYNYMVEYYKDDKDKSRLLRDIKKNNPKNYLDMLSPSMNSGLYNALRTQQGLDPSLESLFYKDYDPNSDEPVEDFDINNLTEINYVDNIGGGAGFTSMSGDHGHADWQNVPLDLSYDYQGMGTNQHAVDSYLASDQFNLGPKAAEKWLANYNKENLATFKQDFGKAWFTNSDPNSAYPTETLNEEQYNKFLNYVPGQEGENRNDLFENIHKAMNHQIAENNIGSNTLTFNNPNNNEESLLDYGNADMPEYLKDRRMGLLNASGDRLNAMKPNMWGHIGNFLGIDNSQNVAVTNERSNQPTSFYEANVGKYWNDLGHWANAPVGAPPLSGLIFNTLDWAGDIVRPAAISMVPNSFGWKDDVFGDAQYYEPGKRLIENPNWRNFGMVGLDAASFIPVGRAGSMLWNSAKQGARNTKFLTSGLNSSKGLRGNFNTLKGNFSDFRYMNPKLKNMRSFDKSNPGALRTHLNQQGPFTVNTPAGRQYTLTGDMFSPNQTLLGRNNINYGAAFDKYKHFGIAPGYIGTSLMSPNQDITFGQPSFLNTQLPSNPYNQKLPLNYFKAK